MLLRHFSRVRLCATPQTAAHQAPPSLGFSRQEHWSGLPFPSPVHEWKVKVKPLSGIWLSDPMDCSLPGSSIHGIFQARVLEWGAIAFSVSSSLLRLLLTLFYIVSRLGIMHRCFDSNMLFTRALLLMSCSHWSLPRRLHKMELLTWKAEDEALFSYPKLRWSWREFRSKHLCH